MFEELKAKLEANGFVVSVFASAGEAAAYLNGAIDRKTVGMGGSMTLAEMGLRESLGAHNALFCHGFTPAGPARVQALAAGAQVYLLSVNGLDAETGALINIDGTGNRVASSLFGHEKVYFVVGKNKIASDFHSALHRARNVAAPKNAQRLGRKTPCAVKGDRCYDCNSPERICRGLVVHYRPMSGTETEVVLIDQELGY